MLTNLDIARFADLAGESFTWDGVKGCSRPASDVRKNLRTDILNRQGGVCVQCGREAVNPEFCHIVARGPKVKGFLPGNIFVGCASCNASTKPLYDETGDLISGIEVLTLDMLARPDLVALEWTPFPILRTLGK